LIKKIPAAHLGRKKKSGKKIYFHRDLRKGGVLGERKRNKGNALFLAGKEKKKQLRREGGRKKR